MPYSEVNSERRVKEQIEMKVQDENRSYLTEKNEVTWREYLKDLLHVDDVQEAELAEVMLKIVCMM